MAVMVAAGFAGALVYNDGASADSVTTADVSFTEDTIATKGTTTANISFTENDSSVFSSGKYTAKLVNSSGTSQSSALSKTSGSFSTSTFTDTITVTAPSTAGTYTIEVVFTETLSDTEATTKEVTVKANLRVCEPITLTVKVSNDGSLAITDAPVYFYVDGKKIDDSKTTLTVDAGSSATLTYAYFNKDLSKGSHTYYVDTSDTSYNIEGLGTHHTFYYEQGNNDLMTWLMVVVFIIVLIAAIVVFRKPVKNYGKPKARR